MPRYKGRQDANAIERDFPHIVEIVVPPGGLRTRLDAIYEFHARHGIKAQKGRGRRAGEWDITRWRFANPAIATAFAAEFADLTSA